MRQGPFRAVAELRRFRDAIEITVFAERPDGSVDIAQPLTLQNCEPGDRMQPAFYLRMQEAQELMDELWRCGVRPTEAAGSAGQAAAMQKHLDDMRTVAWHALKLQK